MSNSITAGKFLRDSLILLCGVTLASLIFPGISYASTSDLIFVILLLFFFNIIVKPLLIFFALPFVVFSFGLGIWIINALLFYLAGEWISGFEVNSFYTALGGAFIVSLTSIIANVLLNPKIKVRFNVNGSYQAKANKDQKKSIDDDVIDV